MSEQDGDILTGRRRQLRKIAEELGPDLRVRDAVAASLRKWVPASEELVEHVLADVAPVVAALFAGRDQAVRRPEAGLVSGEVRWRDVPSEFGSAMPFGSCNAVVGSTVCGYPRRSDGTCYGGHPAPPNWTPPHDEDES